MVVSIRRVPKIYLDVGAHYSIMARPRRGNRCQRYRSRRYLGLGAFVELRNKGDIQCYRVTSYRDVTDNMVKDLKQATMEWKVHIEKNMNITSRFSQRFVSGEGTSRVVVKQTSSVILALRPL